MPKAPPIAPKIEPTEPPRDVPEGVVDVSPEPEGSSRAPEGEGSRGARRRSRTRRRRRDPSVGSDQTVSDTTRARRRRKIFRAILPLACHAGGCVDFDCLL